MKKVCTMYTIEKGVLENSCAYFHSPSAVARSMFFYIKCAGHFYCDGNYCIERESYTSFLLMYIKKGEGSITIDNKTYTVKENEAVIINCYKPHRYETSTGWETLWIHFDGNVSGQYFQLLNDRVSHIISLKNSTLIPDYIASLINKLSNNKILNEALLSCDIQRALAELLLLSNESSIINAKKFNSISESINYIKNNFKNKLTLNEISHQACLSPYHFSRIFKKETGYSPYEYITMIRLNYAKSLLKTSKLLVKEIAFQSGFNSESNFVSSFKQHTNLTPSEFRSTPF